MNPKLTLTLKTLVVVTSVLAWGYIFAYAYLLHGLWHR